MRLATEGEREIEREAICNLSLLPLHLARACLSATERAHSQIARVRAR
jgi:hypothetical protein